jgi:hypothetical protein
VTRNLDLASHSETRSKKRMPYSLANGQAVGSFDLDPFSDA